MRVVRTFTYLAAVLLVPALLHSQDAQPVTLGDAARLAAANSAPALAAQLRTREAEARLKQKKADLLPTLSTTAVESGHTLNSATFGFSFPTPEGEAPLLDPNGQIIGPVNMLDLRAHVTVPAVDFAARARVAGARTSVRARCRISVAKRSSDVAQIASAPSSSACRSREITCVDTGSARSPRRSSTRAS